MDVNRLIGRVSVGCCISIKFVGFQYIFNNVRLVHRVQVVGRVSLGYKVGVSRLAWCIGRVSIDYW